MANERDPKQPYDVVIVGGGPAGLSAALALGRARKRVLVCDAGPRRNQAAVQINNFVTRDHTPPDEFRRIARAQLGDYASVEVRDVAVAAIGGARGAFAVQLSSDAVAARRILLATGMVDELLPLEGFRELWGRSIFQCPYCHGFEVQDRRWAYLVLPGAAAHFLPFALQARGWTRELCVFTSAQIEVPEDARRQLTQAGIRLETTRVARLIARDQTLEAVELADGSRVPCDVLFTHPPQRQVALVQELGLALDEDGFIQAHPMLRETSVAGIYASGDLTTRMQGAILAAASGTHAAAMINLDVTMELANAGLLSAP